MRKEAQKEPAILRQMAEELLKKEVTKSGSPLSEAETQKLIHELEVHQIGLELQNDELILAKQQAAIITEKYIELYDFAPTGYFTLSPKGEIIQLNLWGAKMLGKDRSQLKNRLFHLFVTDDSKLLFKVFLGKVFSSNVKEMCDVTLSADAIPLMFIHLTGIVAENGDQCYVTATDITEIKRAEMDLRVSNEFNQSLLQTIPFDMDIVDGNGNILYLSDGLKHYFGGEALGKKCWNLYRDDQKQCSDCPLHTGIRIGETKLYESDEVLDGKTFEISHTGMIFNGQKAMLEIFIDISERKQAEQELIKAKEHAEESDRLKSAFLTNMSHEIRTPMNGILGFAELLKEPELTGEVQQYYIGVIKKSGARMLNIINNIVDISKIESGQMKTSISETNVNEQIEFIYKLFKNEGEQKGLRLFCKNALPKKEAIIHTDRAKLYAILTNLVKNAIKYTKEGSIEFGVSTLRQAQCGANSTTAAVSAVGKLVETVELQFYVKDTGIGIPIHRQEAIFERFIQADIVDKMARQGAGLGLSISKAYVEMLGGRIWVESEEGKGSTFYFTLPYHFEPEEKIVIENIVSANVESAPKRGFSSLRTK